MPVNLRLARRGDAAFTLIEVLAALFIFSIVTIGIVPLMLSATRGTNISRATTISKNAALEAMERVRGLPYHVDIDRQPANTKVDVLDMFFPDAVGGSITGQSYASGVFTTVCTASSTTNPACLADKLPTDLPNFSLTYRACFVAGNNTACLDTPANRALPSATRYHWRGQPGAACSDSANCTDAPPAGVQLMEMEIRTTFRMFGDTRDFTLRTLLGDRDFGDREIRASAAVDHLVDVQTNFEESGQRTSLQAVFGSATASMEATAIQALATQDVDAARFSLQDITNPDVVELLVPQPGGATGSAAAPPDDAPPDIVADSALVSHPFGPLGSVPVGFVDESSVEGLSASIALDLPTAEGTFDMSGIGDDGALAGWVTNVADDADLFLDPNAPMVAIADPGYGGNTILETGEVISPSLRKVEAITTATMNRLRILPTLFASGTGSLNGERSVMIIDGFFAETQCTSNPDGTAVADATWGANVSIWIDSNDNDDPSDGQYFTFNVGDDGTAGWPSDPLSDLTILGLPANPLVYDDPADDNDDLHLFDRGGENGYFEDASTDLVMDEMVSADQRTTRASVRGAISLSTVPVTDDVDDSGFVISIGSLTCSADDQR